MELKPIVNTEVPREPAPVRFKHFSAPLTEELCRAFGPQGCEIFRVADWVADAGSGTVDPARLLAAFDQGRQALQWALPYDALQGVEFDVRRANIAQYARALGTKVHETALHALQSEVGRLVRDVARLKGIGLQRARSWKSASTSFHRGELGDISDPELQQAQDEFAEAKRDYLEQRLLSGLRGRGYSIRPDRPGSDGHTKLIAEKMGRRPVIIDYAIPEEEGLPRPQRGTTVNAAELGWEATLALVDSLMEDHPLRRHSEMGDLEGEVIPQRMRDGSGQWQILPTRLLPAEKSLSHEPEFVIASGRLAGYYLDDVLNTFAEHAETGITIDPVTGAQRTVNLGEELKKDQPFISVTSDGRLYLSLPTARSEWKTPRRILAREVKRKRDQLAPSLMRLDRTQEEPYAYKFRVNDFDFVARQLQGQFTLSQAAYKLVEQFHKESARRQKAQANLHNYDEAVIGGLKDGTRVRQNQKKTLADLDAQNHCGAVFLNTGEGKTFTAALIFWMAIRDGRINDPGTNGRLLYVADRKGAFDQEVEKFFTPAAAREICDPRRLTQLTYREYQQRVKDGSLLKDGPFVQVVFDEAGIFKSRGSATTKALFDHNPRNKVLMTASAAQNDSREAVWLHYLSTADLQSPAEAESAKYDEDVLRRKQIMSRGRVIGVDSRPRSLELFAQVILRRVLMLDFEDGTVQDPVRQEVKVRLPAPIAKRYAEHVAGAVLPPKEEGGMPVSLQSALAAAHDLASNQKRIRKAEASLDGSIEVDPQQLQNARAVNSAKFARDRRELTDLADMPGGGVFPKIDALFDQHIIDPAKPRKTVYFAESPAFVKEAARELSRRLPGVHAALLGDELLLFKNGRLTQEETASGSDVEWREHVAREVLPKLKDLTSLVVHGDTYERGYNLQFMDDVVHLDVPLDHEKLHQRTARVNRAGRFENGRGPVREIMMLSTYDSKQPSLDQVRYANVVMQEQALGKVFKLIRRFVARPTFWSTVVEARDGDSRKMLQWLQQITERVKDSAPYRAYYGLPAPVGAPAPYSTMDVGVLDGKPANHDVARRRRKRADPVMDAVGAPSSSDALAS